MCRATGRLAPAPRRLTDDPRRRLAHWRPSGFSGVVLQNLGPPGGEAKWRRRAAFDALRVWRLETAPDPEGDGTWRTFSAMQVAQRVAQCDPDRVSATVEGMRAKPGDA